MPKTSNGTWATRCRRKFLRYFKAGFRDETYFDWERGYKERAHQQWVEVLDRAKFKALLARPVEIAAHAVRIESRTNLLFSFEKMALRDAVKIAGRRKLICSRALRLSPWQRRRPGPLRKVVRCRCPIAASPDPRAHLAARHRLGVHRAAGPPHFPKTECHPPGRRSLRLRFPLPIEPSWPVYRNLLDFAKTIRRANRDLRPRDMIDLQSFIWVQGSDEYPN
jgi:hypothetical protein